jgi:hypothetical protein
MNADALPRIALDPREVDALVAELDARQELVYRLAIRGLCDRCRRDHAFERRTEELMLGFARELDAVLAEAGRLASELTRE